MKLVPLATLGIVDDALITTCPFTSTNLGAELTVILVHSHRASSPNRKAAPTERTELFTF